MKIDEISYVTAVIHTETKDSKGSHKSFEEELKKFMEQQKKRGGNKC